MSTVSVAITALLASAHGVVVLKVDSTIDQGGSCPSQTGHVCTYRAALQEAARLDRARPESEVIQILLPAGQINISWTPPLPKLEVPGGRKRLIVEILGATTSPSMMRSVIDGTYKHQLLHTYEGVEVTIRNVTFQNGAAFDGVADGGAISNDGIMVIEDCDFFSNAAKGGGGAISSSVNLTIARASFKNNSAANGGALSSTGYKGHLSSCVGTDLAFADNFARGTAGAVLNAQGAFSLVRGSFARHAAAQHGAVGGTLFNGDDAHMTLTDVTITHAYAGSGGLLANGAKTARLVATRVDFSNGNATDFAGGAVLNKGSAWLESCTFRENMAHNPTHGSQAYAQGATLAVDDDASLATLVNCSIDGARAKRHEEAGAADVPSEIYLSTTSKALLNLTFVNLTSCHRDTLKVDNADRHVIVRGSSICEDAPLPPDVVDARTKSLIAGCDEADAPHQCGRRALCSAGELGVTCTCPVKGPSSAPLPEPMWGYPYGGDAVIPGSAGFDGCFEQWNASLGNLSGSGCLVAPAFAPAATELACCALRSHNGPATPVHATVHALPDAEDHGQKVALSPASVQVSKAAPDASLVVNSTSFDGHSHRLTTVHVHWMPGDAYCTPGERALCVNSSGIEQWCTSQTKFPKDQLRMTSDCLASTSAHATGCGYTTFGAKCTCPVCVAHKQYACNAVGCPVNGSVDGTITCNEHGTGFAAQCDCTVPYAYYPSPPPAPPSTPPSAPDGPSPAVLAAVAVVLILALVGVSCYCRRRRQRAQQLQQMNQSLLNAAPDGVMSDASLSHLPNTTVAPQPPQPPQPPQ